MQKYRELFKSYFIVDYINIECNIPQFIRNKIQNFSIEYQDEYNTYITCDKSREMYIQDDDIYLNRINFTDIMFNINGMICNYQIVTYTVRLSKSIKKCINQIDFIILYPIYEVYETNKGIYVSLLKYLNDVIKSTIKRGINRKLSDEVSFGINKSEKKKFNSIINNVSVGETPTTTNSAERYASNTIEGFRSELQCLNVGFTVSIPCNVVKLTATGGCKVKNSRGSESKAIIPTTTKLEGSEAFLHEGELWKNIRIITLTVSSFLSKFIIPVILKILPIKKNINYKYASSSKIAILS